VAEITAALYKHACAVYEAMEAAAETNEDGTIWTGHLTHLFAELQLPTPQYTYVTKSLKEMDCIKQLQRGGGRGVSKWALLQPPNEELFLAKGTDSKRRAGLRAAIDEQRLNDFAERLSKVETELDVMKMRMAPDA
jgi:hypothetical protein